MLVQLLNGWAAPEPAWWLNLQAHPDVIRNGLDRKVHGYTAESVPLIRADEAHGLGFTGRGATVAVLDIPELPATAVVIGGGLLGLEAASVGAAAGVPALRSGGAILASGFPGRAALP